MARSENLVSVQVPDTSLKVSTVSLVSTTFVSSFNLGVSVYEHLGIFHFFYIQRTKRARNIKHVGVKSTELYF